MLFNCCVRRGCSSIAAGRGGLSDRPGKRRSVLIRDWKTVASFLAFQAVPLHKAQKPFLHGTSNGRVVIILIFEYNWSLLESYSEPKPVCIQNHTHVRGRGGPCFKPFNLNSGTRLQRYAQQNDNAVQSAPCLSQGLRCVVTVV